MDVTPERNAMPAKGARFFRDGADVMFEFVIDPGNIIGPRPGNKADSEKHPEAWAAFVEEQHAEAQAAKADEAKPKRKYQRKAA